jgi:C-terminal processing protease CtpA/Prc
MQTKKEKHKLNCNTISIVVLLLITFSSCSIHKVSLFSPIQKIAPEALRFDLSLLQNVLEREHPSLYWNTEKQEIDAAFATAKLQLKDSLTEVQFRKIVSEVVSKIKCGHTSVRASKSYDKWINTANLSYFPFGARLFSDSIILTYNLYRKDTLIPRGALLKSINGRSSQLIMQQMYSYVSTDANANNFKNIRISNNFPLFHLLVFDSSKQYKIVYEDSLGVDKTITVTDFKRPPPDTSKKISKPTVTKKITPKEKRKLKFLGIRRLEIDTQNSTAIITLNSFSGGRQKKFFRKTFRKINAMQLKNVVFDVRNNGGGVIGNSTALTKYIAKEPFKVADSVYAIKKTSRYNKYIKFRFWYGLTMLPITRKKKDDKFHFLYFERKKYHPKANNHFDGNVYAITGGYSFSATTLFLNVIKNQANVTLVGEETGGGAYGNTAVYIPDLTLPNSKLRVRMPIFRVVMNAKIPKENTGIKPHYYIPPTIKSIQNATDPKMNKVMELIKKPLQQN